MRLGVLGGTFDPVHNGHLAAARAAAAALRLDRVLLVPAAQPPHKANVHASAEQRLAMVEAAVAGDPLLAASRIELDRPGPSYTVDTLRALAPQGELFFICGADVLAQFTAWHRWQEILRLAKLAVVSRPGADVASPLPVLWVRGVVLDISSEDIRRRVREGRPIRGLVPEAVEAIIRREGLYRDGLAGAPG
jgi:nicotinate-nucleotide adenylyltransferase